MAHKHLLSHDRFFRAAMAEPRVVKDFFQAHLPKELQKIISWDSIRLQKESYIDDKLKLQITDMLYAANFNNKPGYIYLLIEHQSTVDPLMPFRLLKYILAIQDDHLKQSNQNKLPLIYPVVFYTGKPSSNHVTDIFELYDQYELAKNIFLKPYHLIDLTTINDEELKQHLWSGVMTRSLKHIYDRDIVPCLKNMLNELQIIEKKDGIGYIYTILNYLINTGETKNHDEFVETVKLGFTEQIGDKIMTIAQQLREEGLMAGLNEGRLAGLNEGRLAGLNEGRLAGLNEGRLEERVEIAIRLIKRNMNINEIVVVTGLSYNEIYALKYQDK